MNAKTFFAPRSVAIVGVSSSGKKLGSVILQNVLDAGFGGKIYAVNPKHGGEALFGVPCVAQVSDIGSPVDLVVVVIPAKYVDSVIDDCVENRTKNVIVISAGFGEIHKTALEHLLREKCKNNGIALLGPNCLGAIFPHHKLNASFSDGFPEKGNICFVSQSGAFCTAILDWAADKGIGFSHFVGINPCLFPRSSFLDTVPETVLAPSVAPAWLEMQDEAADAWYQQPNR